MQQSYLRTEQFSWDGVDIFGWDVLYPNQLGNSPAERELTHLFSKNNPVITTFVSCLFLCSELYSL
jgi:hypothetical protein